MKTAERCIEFLQSHGTTRNWQTIVMYNYNGRLVGYEGGSNWATYNYRFDDDSYTDVRCSYETEQWVVKVFIGDTIIATINSCNYMKF